MHTAVKQMRTKS